MIRSWITFVLMTFLILSPFSGYATAADVVLTVDRSIPVSSTNFHTIQDAINTFEGSNAKYTEIDIKPGTYVETIQLQQTSAATNLENRNFDLGETIPTVEVFQGLQIIGDNRPCFPQYQNGYELAASSTQTSLFTLETSVAGIGPYPVLLNPYGAQPTTVFGPLPAQNSNPLNAIPPPVNNFAGGFAVVDRGTGGLPAKTLNVQNKGAAACIAVDSSPTGIFTSGGSDPTITIPTWSIGRTNGLVLEAAITANPSITITISPPATFYNPPIGSNFGMVTLSHPGGNFSKIQVTISDPLPAIDPFLARGVTPVLEQPVFDDPRLELVPGDQIILCESDVFGVNGRQTFTVQSLSGNIITLTTPVNPAVINITKPGTSLTFLPNVRIMPATGGIPVFTAQSIGFSMNGIWIDTNPATSSTNTVGIQLGGVQAYLSNIFVADTHRRSNSNAINITNGSSITILDGWRNSSKNRRLSVNTWASGIFIDGNSNISAGSSNGGIIFVTNLNGGNSLGLDDFSSANLGSLILMGNSRNRVPSSSSLAVTTGSHLTSTYLLTVNDVYGTGIRGGDINCNSFRLERIYKPAGFTNRMNALELIDGGVFEVTPFVLFQNTGKPTYSIRTSSIVKDCFDAAPVATVGPTVPNIGICCDDRSTFVSYKDLKFSNNSLDYLTVQDNQFITPGWSLTPGNIFPIFKSGKLNPVYQKQELRACKIHLTLDPSEQFDYRGIYINADNPGKTFRITSKNASWHTLTLTKGHFLGTKYKTLRFKPHEGASVSLQILSPSEVEVLGMHEVEYFYK